MKPAVVLGMGVNGLGILRGLGRQGIEAYGIDKEEAIAFSSKYCKRRYIFPDPAAYPEECLSQIIKLGKNLGDKAFLLPTNDSYVAFMSKFRTELSDYFLFNIPESSLLENILDKMKQYQLAMDLGIPVPKTISPKHIDELEEESISYPAIIKGKDSKKWSSVFTDNGFAASCYNELSEYFRLALDRNVEVIIQEMVIGPNKNHFGMGAYYSKEKELLGVWSVQRVRQYPVDMGNGTYLVTVNNPELIALGREFLEGLGYTGAGNIQFKYDDRDGQYKLIELNPRFGMANIISTCAGVSAPYLNYLDCTGEKVAPSLTFMENIRWWNAVSDVRSFWVNRKRGDISFIEWVKSILRAKCFPYFAGDDLKPVCRCYASVVWRWVKRVFGFKT